MEFVAFLLVIAIDVAAITFPTASFFPLLLVLALVSSTVVPALLLFFIGITVLDKELRSTLLPRWMLFLLIWTLFYAVGSSNGGQTLNELSDSSDFFAGNF